MLPSQREMLALLFFQLSVLELSSCWEQRKMQPHFKASSGKPSIAYWLMLHTAPIAHLRMLSG